jgi:hypothetical protein
MEYTSYDPANLHHQINESLRDVVEGNGEERVLENSSGGPLQAKTAV